MATARPQASVLFAPFELRLYQRWRSQHHPDSGSDPADESTPPVPNAYDYADFQTWRAKERIRVLPSKYITSSSEAAEGEEDPQDDDDIPTDCTVASKCGHALHPAVTKEDGENENENENEYCAVCVFKMHTNLVAALWDKWQDLGAPWRATHESECKAYNATARAHQSAKVALVNAMLRCEETAVLERKWNVANGKVHAASVYGPGKALDMYEKSIHFPTTLGVATESTPAKCRGKQRKSIVYAPDTPEDTKHRPQAFWARNLSSHDPGSPHACPSADGYWDTSYYNDWRFAVSQCRILLCYYPDDVSLKLKYRDLNMSADQGLDNPAVEQLIVLLEQYIAKQSEAVQGQWYQYLRCTGDIFLVWKGEEDVGLFGAFERVESLVGSHVEEYAREVGDIDDEEWTGRKGGRVDGEEEEWEEQVSMASDCSDEADYDGSKDEVEDITLVDLMAVEKDAE
jgi:hypothetical protein